MENEETNINNDNSLYMESNILRKALITSNIENRNLKLENDNLRREIIFLSEELKRTKNTLLNLQGNSNNYSVKRLEK